MFLRSHKRWKNGKQHRYFSIVENRRRAEARALPAPAKRQMLNDECHECQGFSTHHMENDPVVRDAERSEEDSAGTWSLGNRLAKARQRDTITETADGGRQKKAIREIAAWR